MYLIFNIILFQRYILSTYCVNEFVAVKTTITIIMQQNRKLKENYVVALSTNDSSVL